ncbi:hypothetical protein ABIA32_001783 [Streptacidiphilus sp. MAP12-20]|uniref:hypothetical protein n=1 Tax=Streptacidiphilus sp. MAP12-20 TaxID=3156299 RepID=UPI003517BC33
MTRRQQRARAALAGLACVVALSVSVAGCGPKSETPRGESPATLVPLPGSSPSRTAAYGQVRKVVLTAVADQRLGIRTVPVQTDGAGDERVPITAVIYDPNGVPWVYLPAGTHAYLRQAVTIRRYEGDTVVLSRGPSAGSQVVVVAAAELLGAEYGVGEE